MYQSAKRIFEEVSKANGNKKHFWVSSETFNSIFSEAETIEINENHNLELGFGDFGFEISMRATVVYEDGCTVVQILTTFDGMNSYYKCNQSLNEVEVAIL